MEIRRRGRKKVWIGASECNVFKVRRFLYNDRSRPLPLRWKVALLKPGRREQNFSTKEGRKCNR